MRTGSERTTLNQLGPSAARRAFLTDIYCWPGAAERRVVWPVAHRSSVGALLELPGGLTTLPRRRSPVPGKSRMGASAKSIIRK